MLPHVGWARAMLACAALACVLPVAARAAAGPPGADIHVEWQPDVDEATQQKLASQYRLANPRKLEDTYTWRYELTDPSRENIEAIVRDPHVNDTHEINRNQFALEPTAPRTPRRLRFSSGDELVRVADVLAVALIVFAAVVGATRTTPARLLQRGIPEIDAVTAGIFRIAFGSLVLLFFATHPVDASWLTATFDLEIEGRLHQAIIAWLQGHPGVVNAITPWILTTGAAFTIGLRTRITYALFVAGAIAWSYVAMSLNSPHPLASFILGLVALLPSRWGDALSVDAYMRRLRGQPSLAGPAGKRYGYAVWVPTLAFGVGYAAAAWAKLSTPPGWTDWILNGTVKYHFITDSGIAPVSWGLQLAHYPQLAVVASLFAIATEALVVSAAFVRSEAYRFAMGLAALALVGGFYVFMGHFWPGWWLLLLGFLPWQRIGAMAVPRAQPVGHPPADGSAAWHGLSRASTLQLAAIAFVVVQQVVVSTVQLERAPMFSFFPMYADTYSSPANFEARRPPRYRIVVTPDRGTALPCNPHEEFVREFEAAVAGSEPSRAAVWRALGECVDDVDALRAVSLEGKVRSFDWDRLVFTERPAPPIGPLRADGAGRAPVH